MPDTIRQSTTTKLLSSAEVASITATASSSRSASCRRPMPLSASASSVRWRLAKAARFRAVPT